MNQEKFNGSKKSDELRKGTYFQQLFLWAFIVLGIGIVFVFLLYFKPVRVGDGSEYYALYLAIVKTLRPWMTDGSFTEYARLFDSGNILQLVSAEKLSQAFPELKIQGTIDFNHFWFYSLLAAIIGSTIGLTGFQLEPHSSFIVLHWLLLCVPTLLAFRYFGWKGVVIVLLMTFSAPLVWFTNKVHTEFFTYSLALASVILVIRVSYIGAAVALAVASTQNPSFAIVAGFLLCIRVVVGKHEKYALWELVGIVTTVVVVFLHPAYYFFRFGVLTPQLLAGGANLGGNLSSFYIWLFDPDLGLLPNWPTGLAFIVLGITWLCSQKNIKFRNDVNLPFALFALVYFLVAVYAHSSTQNINSGATPGVSRYALWYTPLFFPFAFWSLIWVTKNKIRTIATAFVMLLLVILNIYQNFPARPESYSTPTKLSAIIQKYFPGSYNPPAELFFERYSGLGEGPSSAAVMAVIGPDCKKVLLIPGANRNIVTAPTNCMLDTVAVSAMLKARQSMQRVAEYMNLTDYELNKIIFTPMILKSYGLGEGDGEGGLVLRSGWSSREPWGVWSDGQKVELEFPLPLNINIDDNVKIALNLVGFIHGAKKSTKISIHSGSLQLWEGVLTGVPSDVVIEIPTVCYIDNRVSLSLLVDNPLSPLDLGISTDPRKLGVGFLSFKYLVQH